MNLKRELSKESVSKKYLLLCAVVAFVATFLPWQGYPYLNGASLSINGWYEYGFLTVIGSLGVLLAWVLPRAGVELGLPWSENAVDRVLAGMILAGPVLVLIMRGFSFSFLSLGFYVVLVAGGAGLYFALTEKAAHKKVSRKHKENDHHEKN